MAVKLINTASYDEAVKSGKVFVDFYADWCGPCAMISPIVAKISEEYSDVSFYKVNIDNDMSIAERYRIMSIPTLLCLKDGEVVETIVGYMEEAQLKAVIDKAFA